MKNEGKNKSVAFIILLNLHWRLVGGGKVLLPPQNFEVKMGEEDDLVLVKFTINFSSCLKMCIFCS